MNTIKKYIPTTLVILAVFCVLLTALWSNSSILNAATECTTKTGVKCPPGTTRSHCGPGQSVDVAKYGDGNCHCPAGPGKCSAAEDTGDDCSAVQSQIDEQTQKLQDLQTQYPISQQKLSQARSDLQTYSLLYSNGTTSTSTVFK